MATEQEWKAEMARLMAQTYWVSPASRSEVTYRAVEGEAAGLELVGTLWVGGGKAVVGAGDSAPRGWRRANPRKWDDLRELLEDLATERTGYDIYA